jgi:hypothetical protein
MREREFREPELRTAMLLHGSETPTSSDADAGAGPIEEAARPLWVAGLGARLDTGAILPVGAGQTRERRASCHIGEVPGGDRYASGE